MCLRSRHTAKYLCPHTYAVPTAIHHTHNSHLAATPAHRAATRPPAAPPPGRPPGVHPARRSVTRPRHHHAATTASRKPRRVAPPPAALRGPRRRPLPAAALAPAPVRGLFSWGTSRPASWMPSRQPEPRVPTPPLLLQLSTGPSASPSYRAARLRLTARAAGGSSLRSLVLDDAYMNKGMFLDTLEQLDEMTRTTGTNTLTGNHGYIVLTPDKLDLIWLLQ